MTSIFLAAAVAVGSWLSVPGGSWSPDATVLADIRSGLAPFVKEQASEQHQALPEWATYSFQYQGQSHNGQSVVYINAFCVPPPEYATKQFVVVFDGGTCFFQVKYDPKKKRFFEFGFNGVA